MQTAERIEIGRQINGSTFAKSIWNQPLNENPPQDNKIEWPRHSINI